MSQYQFLRGLADEWYEIRDRLMRDRDKIDAQIKDADEKFQALARAAEAIHPAKAQK